MRIAWDIGGLHEVLFSDLTDSSSKRSWPFASQQPDERSERGRDGEGAARKLDMLRALDRMVESLTVAREAQTRAVDLNRLVRSFNALLQQVKEHFPGSDELRLIEPVTADGSVALIAVRLSLVKRTIDAELARSAKAS